MLTLASDRPLQASEVKMHNCLHPSALASHDLFMGLTGGLVSYGDAFIMKDLIAAFSSLCFAFRFGKILYSRYFKCLFPAKVLLDFWGIFYLFLPKNV